MLKEEQEIVTEKLDDSQIEKLRKEYEKIDRIDPASPTYKKLRRMISNMDKDSLKKLRDAKIKWISMLAANTLDFNK